MKKAVLGARKVALCAVLTALLEAGKLALAVIPNVEVVTLLCAAYGYVFGLFGMLAVSLFVVVETLVWGVGTWVLSYVIHWNFVCLVFFLLGRKRVRNRFVLTAAAAVLTVLFGVTSSIIDIGLFSGAFDNFFYRFSVYYVRGIAFYAIETVCNLIVFPTAFIPLSDLLYKSKEKFMPDVRR
jgi:energy-coupling factor transport system substrate-specific component